MCAYGNGRHTHWNGYRTEKKNKGIHFSSTLSLNCWSEHTCNVGSAAANWETLHLHNLKHLKIDHNPRCEQETIPPILCEYISHILCIIMRKPQLYSCPSPCPAHVWPINWNIASFFGRDVQCMRPAFAVRTLLTSTDSDSTASTTQ